MSVPDAAFIAAAVYAVLQVAIKPLIKLGLPDGNPYQDNVVRIVGFLLTYALAAVDVMVQHSQRPPEPLLTITEAWALLPIAAAIYSTSALAYHVGTPAPKTPADAVQALAEALAKAMQASPTSQGERANGRVAMSDAVTAARGTSETVAAEAMPAYTVQPAGAQPHTVAEHPVVAQHAVPSTATVVPTIPA